MKDRDIIREAEPRASRPQMDDYGVPAGSEEMLPWSWARERLSKSHNYWFTTVRSDGAPHTMPIWGVWVDNAWYFSTSAKSRKAQNLSTDPHCVVCNEDAAEAVILEGIAHKLLDSEIPRQVSVAYQAKYGWELKGSVFEVRPRVVFAMPEEQFPTGVTRWKFR